jgi:hypothetical protein
LPQIAVIRNTKQLTERKVKMTRNFKALGLMLVATFAMSAVVASGAQALKVTVGASPAWLTGEQVGKATFTVENGGPVVSCGSATGAATVKNGDETITAIPTTYSGCQATIGTEAFKATVTPNDCDALFHGGVEVSSTTFKEGEGDLKCPAGKVVEVHIYKNEAETEELCTLTIAEQLNRKGEGLLHNVSGSGGAPDYVMAEGGVTVNMTRDGSLLCGKASNTAIAAGLGIVKAFEDKGGSVSNGTVTGLVEGNQVSLTASK